MPAVSNYTALLSDNSWAGDGATGQSAIVTYSFATTGASYLSDSGYSTSARASYRSFTETDKGYAREAFRKWGEISGLTFIEVSAGTGDMRLGKMDFNLVPGYEWAGGFAYFPSRSIQSFYAYDNDIAGDVFINTRSSNSVYLMLHEIGHALGLKHPFEGPTTLTTSLDNHSNTVMSYTGNYPSVLGPFDRQAIQSIYSTNAADGRHLASWSWNAVRQELTMTGKSIADTIYGTGVRDIIDGRESNDRIAGFAGHDWLTGGTGNDTLFGGDGNDVMYGGAGDDTMYGGDSWGDGASGTDTVSFAGAIASVDADLDQRWSGSVWYNSFGADAGRDTFYDIDNLYGGSGNDTLSGNFANNVLLGGAGNDTINGEGGNDRIDGGTGMDRMTGGSGNDTFVLNGAADVVIELAGGGSDWIEAAFTIATLPANVEHVRLTGTAAINATGNGLANWMYGNSAANRIDGGAGDDVIYGGAGRDILLGGAGADRFRYFSTSDSGKTSTTRDIISGFTHGDKIDVSMIDANSVIAGNQAFSFVTAFTGVRGQLQWDLISTNTSGVKTYLVEGDVNGDRRGDFSVFITTTALNGQPGGAAAWKLLATDFIL